MQRREFLQSAAMTSAAAALPFPSPRIADPPAVLKPKRLAAGETVTLVAPANATFEPADLQIATESLEALGFK
jgi:muramoyltetrapeptide carboxypeptidase